MTDSKSTLTPEFRSEQPYLWLKGDESYELPAEMLEKMQTKGAPEINSIRLLASFNETGWLKTAAWLEPIFAKPDYGLLSPAEREFIGVVVSAANHCATCLIVHGHLLGEFIGNHGRARRIGINYRSVDLSAQERAIADYCEKLTLEPNRMEPNDIQRLRDAGLRDDKIFYIIELASAYNLTNRLMSGYGTRPDEGFMQRIAPASGA